MKGISLNEPIIYKHSSFRFFDENEYHITRVCKDDVLLLVYDGILRFTEDHKDYEIYPGEYYIQRRNLYQEGKRVSESPKYLYVHFRADWTEEKDALPMRGVFDYAALRPLMESLNHLSHGHATMIEQTGKFYEILSKLYSGEREKTTASQIAEFIEQNCSEKLTLEMICEAFHFSKNHIINLFKKEYKMSPFEYMNYLKIKKAEYLLEATSESVGSICGKCGFREYSHFYKLFYRANQMSPTKWRSKKRMHP